MGEKLQDAIVEGQILPGPSKDPPWGSGKPAPVPSQVLEQPTKVVVVTPDPKPGPATDSPLAHAVSTGSHGGPVDEATASTSSNGTNNSEPGFSIGSKDTSVNNMAAVTLDQSESQSQGKGDYFCHEELFCFVIHRIIL